MKKNNQIFNIPNLISISRIVLCFPLIYYLSKIPNKLYYHDLNRYSSELIIILIIIFLMLLSDVLDGVVARYLKNITNFGKLIDPVADKVSILIVIIYLTQKPGLEGFLILIYFILLCFRDIMIAVVGLYLMNKNNRTFDSINSGKWFIACSALMFLVFIYDPILIKFSYLKWFLYSVSIILMQHSTYEYYMRYKKLLKK